VKIENEQNANEQIAINHDVVFTVELTMLDNVAIKNDLREAFIKAILSVKDKHPGEYIRLHMVPWVLSAERIELI